MDEVTRERIFEPFFTTKDVGKGTGLGLSTVFAIVQRLGGQIEVDSAVGRGTRFSIRIPTVVSHPVAAGPAAATSRELRGSGTVLVVEDQDLVKETVLRYLEQLGYTPLAAATPEEALALCDEHRGAIDALVTDVFMPGMLGPQLARELSERIPHLPVLFISAHPREQLAVSVGLGPTDHLIEKPFSRATLGAAMRDVLAAS
jgi:two-component system cell cycle sensor histidine kinase/response regulator CckA